MPRVKRSLQLLCSVTHTVGGIDNVANIIVNSLFNEELNEIGLVRSKGLEWYKLIDSIAYVNVLVRKAGPMLSVYAAARSLLSPLEDSYAGMETVDNMHFQRLMSNGMTVDQIFLEHLYYIENDEDALLKMKALAHEMIEPVKPVLFGVCDLQSCYDAENKLAYMNCFYTSSKLLGRPFTLDETTVFPPLDCFFILCKQGRYDEAADYFRRGLANYERKYADPNLPDLVENVWGKWMPYVRMVENGEYEKLNGIMLKSYNDNCDLLEAKHKIKIDRTGFANCK